MSAWKRPHQQPKQVMAADLGTTGGSTSGGATCGTRHSTRSPLTPRCASAAARPCVLDCAGDTTCADGVALASPRLNSHSVITQHITSIGADGHVLKSQVLQCLQSDISQSMVSSPRRWACQYTAVPCYQW
jgi:hypothetical protein